MRISIGILAYNEATRLERTICSLRRQSLLDGACNVARSVEVVCVANGCTDRTADVAREAFERASQSCTHPAAAWRVCELEQASKPHAWNEFVHRLSDPTAEYLILMDADIELVNPGALEALVTMLNQTEHAHAVVGMPRKRVNKAVGRSLAARISMGYSRVSGQGPPNLNGGLYCARASILRQIWLPPEILVEDGFIKAMLVTSFFRQAEDRARLVRAPDAVYEFTPYLQVSSLFRHQRRLIVGAVVNNLLYSRLWALPSDEKAGDYALRQSLTRPRWFNEMLAAHLGKRKWWVLPRGYFQRRLFKQARKLRYFGPIRAIAHLPIVLAAMLVEIPILLSANSELKKSERKW